MPLVSASARSASATLSTNSSTVAIGVHHRHAMAFDRREIRDIAQIIALPGIAVDDQGFDAGVIHRRAQAIAPILRQHGSPLLLLISPANLSAEVRRSKEAARSPSSRRGPILAGEMSEDSMSTNKLQADAVGIPRFTATPVMGAGVFDLTSHARAREALDFGLSVGALGFNIFVVGEDRSARMSATLAYLDAAMEKRPTPADWIYLNNFRHPDQPLPLSLPAGTGRTVLRRADGADPEAARGVGRLLHRRCLSGARCWRCASRPSTRSMPRWRISPRRRKRMGCNSYRARMARLRLTPAAQRPARAGAIARSGDRARDGGGADARAAPRGHCARPAHGADPRAQPRHRRRGGRAPRSMRFRATSRLFPVSAAGSPRCASTSPTRRSASSFNPAARPRANSPSGATPSISSSITARRFMRR